MDDRADDRPIPHRVTLASQTLPRPPPPRPSPPPLLCRVKRSFVVLFFLSSVVTPSEAALHPVLPLMNTRLLPPVGVLRRPVLPWTHHHQPAISAVSPQAWGRGE